MTTRPRTPAPNTPAPGKLPLPELTEMKDRGDRIVMVTAYDAPSGRLADAAGVDLILVGDSAAMVVLGHDSTVPATMDELVMLTRAVTRGAHRPLVIADMPFGSFQVSNEQALEHAIRFLKEAGADAVKLEGAGPTLARVQALVDAGMPVMGHLGLTPQTATILGGFKAQGRTAAKAAKLYEDALALQAAGCFALVLEAVPTQVATRITETLRIPTIGIGAGAGCDGQVLVWHDLLGLYEGHAPRFVKQYADLAPAIRDAIERYAADVRSGAFPAEQHTYSIPADELALLEQRLAVITASIGCWETKPGSTGISSSLCIPASATAASALDQVQPCTARTPATSSTNAQARNAASTAIKARSPAGESEPPLRKTSPPQSASFSGHSTSESTIGTDANARTWRVRRYEPWEPSAFTLRCSAAPSVK